MTKFDQQQEEKEFKCFACKKMKIRRLHIKNKKPMNKKEQLRRTQIAFWMNLPICILSMIILFISVDTGILWKILASSLGFLGFLGFVILIFCQLTKLRKVI